MLEEIARVLFWLGVGEVLARLGLLPIPGPVIGLVLLYANLTLQRRLPDDLYQVSLIGTCRNEEDSAASSGGTLGQPCDGFMSPGRGIRRACGPCPPTARDAV